MPGPKHMKATFPTWLGVALLALCVFPLLRYWPARNNIPEHLLNHPVFVKENLIPPSIGEELIDLIKAIGEDQYKGFPTNAADTLFYKTEHDHVGEAVPLTSTGRCDHPYLIPNNDRTLCTLAGRIDIGRHLILTGGARGLREPYEKIISRVQSFGVYHFDLSSYDVVNKLFENPSFVDVAKKVCPADKQFLDPFQFNFIIQVPGQTVSTHVDGVYFWGASRFQFPQWLLAAMKFSGFWEDLFIHQVQVVGYLHRWKPKDSGANNFENDDDGSFVYWDTSAVEPKVVRPFPLSGSVVDGSKTAHAASVYRMSADIPYIDKSKRHWLRKAKREDRWTLSNQVDGILRNYTYNDLRISMVYRGRCFKDQAEVDRFRSQLHGKDGEDGRIPLDDVLNTFLKDLIKKGQIPKGSSLASLDRLNLALKIIDTYIKYPLPAGPLVPWNYCALPRIMPWLGGVMSMVC